MDTGVTTALNNSVTTGVSGIIGFVTGPFLITIVGLIVVGLALKIGVRMFKKHAHGVSA